MLVSGKIYDLLEAFEEFFDMKPSDFTWDFHLKFKLDLPSLFLKFHLFFFVLKDSVVVFSPFLKLVFRTVKKGPFLR